MQLKGKHIFILGLMRFDESLSSTNYTIARHLAASNYVYYIDNPYTLKDYINLYGTEGFLRRKKHFAFKPCNAINTDIDNLKVIITPPVLSINKLPEGKLYRSLQKINERVVRHRIKQVLRKYNIRNYIFINSFNFYYPGITTTLTPDLYVYHCVDPLAFSFEQRHGVISEKKIVQESDLVVCTGKQLFEEKKKLNPNCYFIPNAANLSHSSKALAPGLAIHHTLINIPKPIIGYLGNIERRIDYDLLKEVTEMNPDKSFVFTGPQSSQHIPKWFYNTPNIYLTGAVPYEQIPAVIKGFDIALIPFKKDDISANIFPLKLFEYLGAGKPVIATDFNPDLKVHTGECVAYCKNGNAFSKAITTALSNDSKELKVERLNIAAQNTWEIRANEFADLLSRYLHKNLIAKTHITEGVLHTE